MSLSSGVSATFDDGNDRQLVFRGEFKVALVVRRAAEDGAGAVIHEHEIGHVQRHFMPVERMDDFNAGIEAFFLGLFDGFFAGAGAFAIGDELGQFGIGCRQFCGQADGPAK